MAQTVLSATLALAVQPLIVAVQRLIVIGEGVLLDVVYSFGAPVHILPLVCRAPAPAAAGLILVISRNLVFFQLQCSFSAI
jgi:hypothetical protein